MSSLGRRWTGRRLFPVLLAAFAVLGASAPGGRIAFVSNEGELAVVRPDGSARRDLGSSSPIQPASFGFRAANVAEKGFYTWPTWSPDAKRLLAFHVAIRPKEAWNGLYVFDPESGRVLSTYGRPDLRPVYAYWAPDGRDVGLLLGEGRDFSLAVWPPDGGQGPTALATGAPFFFDWSGDASSFAIHVGSDRSATLGVLDRKSRRTSLLSAEPGYFGPASYSPDGRWLAYGTLSAPDRAELRIRSGAGDERVLSGITPHHAVLWSPDGSRVAVATTRSEGRPFDEIRTIAVPSGEAKVIFRETLDAFQWSPKGDRLLVVRRDFESGEWRWIVVDATSGKATPIVAFLPSRPLVMVSEFFDQYALSHRLWSPDGTHFVFTGLAETDASGGDPATSPRVYVAPADGSTPPVAIADGHTAFWSPR